MPRYPRYLHCQISQGYVPTCPDIPGLYNYMARYPRAIYPKDNTDVQNLDKHQGIALSTICFKVDLTHYYINIWPYAAIW